MPHALLVFLGAGLGGLLRHLLVLAVAPRSPHFPAGTLLVNLAGCFAIGLLAPLLLDPPGGPSREPFRLLLLTGLLGGFTTFSAFSRETVDLLRAGRPGPAMLYAALSTLLGLGLAYAGHRLSSALRPPLP